MRDSQQSIYTGCSLFYYSQYPEFYNQVAGCLMNWEGFGR
jgi:hypothetical protein